MIEDYSFDGRKHIKRDYYNKTFSNPYFNRQETRRPGFNTKLYIEVMTVVFLIYLIIYSAMFRVRAVEVQGTDMISPADIQAIAYADINRNKLLIFPGNNLLFVSTGEISSDIQKKYSLNKLEIDKSWQKLTIRVEEKVAYLIGADSHNYYFIDAAGTVTKQLTGDDLAKYNGKFPQLSFTQDLQVNSQPISGRTVNYLIELDHALQTNGFKVKNYQSGEVDEVIANMAAGWQARFSINNALDLSIQNLQLILAKKLANRKFQYIDLRFGDRVTFYPDK